MNDKALAKSAATNTIRDLLQSEEFRSQIAKVLPKHGNAVRFARIALTATFKNPKLLECSRESLLNCLLRLSELGLEPDNRRAHLIPFGRECTLLLDYKGIAELVRRYGDVSLIHCDVVGENDRFICRFGTNGVLEHEPAIANRGKIICAYSYIQFHNGTVEYDVMSTEEIEKVRKRSRAANDGPWVSDWNEMAKKTIFRRHSKMLPLSPEVQDMISADDEPMTERERFNAAHPVTQARVVPTPMRHIAPAKPPKEGDKRADLPQDRFSGDEGNIEPPAQSNAPETSADSTEAFLFENSQNYAKASPQEQLSALEILTQRLSESGYTETHLMELLRRVQLAPKSAVSLSQVPERKLSAVLSDWDNCLNRLSEIKQGK